MEEEGRDLFPLVRSSLRNFGSTPFTAAVQTSEQARMEDIGCNTGISSVSSLEEEERGKGVCKSTRRKKRNINSVFICTALLTCPVLPMPVSWLHLMS